MNGWPVGIGGTKAFCCWESGSKSNVGVFFKTYIGVGALNNRKVETKIICFNLSI